jgi:competence protein ComEC
VIAAPSAEGPVQRADAFVQRMRDTIDARIRAVLPGDRGAIAAMLINGRRDTIAMNVYDALFISGIGHVLSISGYHMAVVAGLIFFVVRAFFALIPGLAERAPIKKWAAFAALMVTGFYLVLSGNQVATQGSFIMIAVVLLGVLFDRPTLTMRTLTVAAMLVLLFAPGSVVHPSFQMSFAATLALIAGYERGALKLRASADSSFGARAALWGVNEIVGLTVASLLAGVATTPYAAYHFHRIAPDGVLANLLAMPMVSAWVMPMGILGVLAMPFGLDAEFWWQMGYGIEWMDAVGLWVASLPGAFGRLILFGTGPLLLATAGLLVVGLLKTPLRFSGFMLAALAVLWAAFTPVPDVQLAADGRPFAVRGPDGRLAFHHSGGDAFAVREWLAADADGRDVHDRGLGAGIDCDPSGCIGKLADGGLVAYGLEPDAFEEDCRRAAIVIAARDDPPPDCPAMVIGRALWRARGALTLQREGSGFVMKSARSKNFDRPWSPAVASPAVVSPAVAQAAAPDLRAILPDGAAESVDEGAKSAPDGAKPRAKSRTTSRARSDDVTPREEDIEADD